MKWPAERVLSFVVDRAIFGQEVFEQVLADATLHLITWEKGYEAQAWPPARRDHWGDGDRAATQPG